MPRLSCFYFLFMLASIGIPLTSGFPAELLIIIGALIAHPTLGITALAGAILCACGVLSFTRRAFFGAVSQASVEQVQDLRPREMMILCVPCILCLLFGFIPNKVLKINHQAAELWLNRVMEQPEPETSEEILIP
jgi:NADH-quinone oxidoreductase subunit M